MALKRALVCIVIATVTALALSGCSSANPASTEQQEAESQAQTSTTKTETVSYDLSGISLSIPEYWKADTEMSEAGTQLIFRLENGEGTLSVEKDSIPQYMTVKTQGSSVVEATNEEIAESYTSISIMSDDHEQTVGEMETIGSGEIPYMRQTFHGTAKLKDVGEIDAVQRNAIVLFDDNASCIKIIAFCPAEQDSLLDDVDALMESIVSQL